MENLIYFLTKPIFIHLAIFTSRILEYRGDENQDDCQVVIIVEYQDNTPKVNVGFVMSSN